MHFNSNRIPWKYAFKLNSFLLLIKFYNHIIMNNNVGSETQQEPIEYWFKFIFQSFWCLPKPKTSSADNHEETKKEKNNFLT